MLRIACWMLIAILVLMAAACGGEGNPGGQVQKPALAVTNEDLEKQLKFDARVQDFTTEGDKLVVSVNRGWMSAPPGMQMRATGQWFTMWQSARAGEGKAPEGLEVVVQHDGEKVARWTAENGYELIPKDKTEATTAE